MQKEKQLIPELRFPQYDRMWQVTLLGKICKIQTGSKDTQDKVENGKYPFYVRSNTVESINSYSFDTKAILTSGDGAGVGKIYHLVNGKFDLHQRVYALTNFKDNFSIEYAYHFFSEKFYKRVMRLSAKNSVDSVRRDMIFDMKMPYPIIPEQQKIAQFLTTVDRRIQNLEKKKDLLEQYKKGVMQKIFKQELRFKNDDGKEFPKWQEKKLSYYLQVSNKKNNDLTFSKADVLSVSGEYGIVNQIAFQGRSFAGASVHNYGVVMKGDIVYTKSPLKSNPFGIIKVNKGADGIVSTLYAVYKVKNEKADGIFLDYYFQLDDNTNRYLRPLVRKGAKNDMKINNQYVLHDPVLFPSKMEQIKIADFLSALDQKIILVNQQIENTRTYKKGLLQQMFV